MSPAPEGFDVVVGLEVHCELLSETKLFCGCPNHFGSEPNTNICPVCLGLPGSLPVLNERAVELAMRIGMSLHCAIKPSVFARKNYFYPDMPKDYQVSQYDEPINVDGYIELPDHSRVGIVRAHIEEDTGKSTHMGTTGRIAGADYSLVDYNRAGVPLVEIVSAPDITSADQARAYVSELRAILVAIGASDGRMEEGSLRVDANVSVRPAGTTELGTRCEVKNLNSLRSVGRAIDYEADRQAALLRAGGRVVQETRHFDEQTGTTGSMRSKEEAFDYRYFPEPDLVPLTPPEALFARAASGVGTLPAERRARLAALIYDDASGIADQIVTAVDLGLDDLVLAAVQLGAPARLALARAANEAAASPDAARALEAGAFAGLVMLEGERTLTATQSKQVLAELLDKGGDPAEIAARLGFEKRDAGEVEALLDRLIGGHPDEWGRFVAGDERLRGFFIKMVMDEMNNNADGRAVGESLVARREAAGA